MQACLDGAFDGDFREPRETGQQLSRGAGFIQKGGKCLEGVDFFKRLCTRDTDDFFNEVEEYCEEMEQECVIARANLGCEDEKG